MKKLIVLTGAGISAESGISTFRDSGGLWEQYDVMKVASIEGGTKTLSWYLNFITKGADNYMMLNRMKHIKYWLIYRINSRYRLLLRM